VITEQDRADDLALLIEEKHLGQHKPMPAQSGIIVMQRRLAILSEDATSMTDWANDHPEEAGLALANINREIHQARTRLEWYRMQLNERN